MSMLTVGFSILTAPDRAQAVSIITPWLSTEHGDSNVFSPNHSRIWCLVWFFVWYWVSVTTSTEWLSTEHTLLPICQLLEGMVVWQGSCIQSQGVLRGGVGYREDA